MVSEGLAGARASVAGEGKPTGVRVAARAAAGLQGWGCSPRPRPLRRRRHRGAASRIKERTQSARSSAASPNSSFAAGSGGRPRQSPAEKTFAVIASLARARAVQASLSFQVGDAAFGSFEGFSGGGVDLKEWTMRAASATGGLAMDALASPWRAVLGLLSLLPQLAGYVFFDLLPQAAALAVALAWNYPERRRRHHHHRRLSVAPLALPLVEAPAPRHHRHAVSDAGHVPAAGRVAVGPRLELAEVSGA